MADCGPQNLHNDEPKWVMDNKGSTTESVKVFKMLQIAKLKVKMFAGFIETVLSAILGVSYL